MRFPSSTAFTAILGENAEQLILSKNRTPLVCDCRRMAAAELRRQHYSLNHIGRILGRHHTTILHLLRSHDALLEYDPHYQTLWKSVQSAFLLA